MTTMTSSSRRPLTMESAPSAREAQYELGSTRKTVPAKQSGCAVRSFTAADSKCKGTPALLGSARRSFLLVFGLASGVNRKTEWHCKCLSNHYRFPGIVDGQDFASIAFHSRVLPSI